MSCASLAVFPPVARGQAAAGEDPGLGAVVGEGLGLGVGLAVGGGDVGVGGREADGAEEAGVGEGRVSGVAHAAARTAAERSMHA